MTPHIDHVLSWFDRIKNQRKQSFYLKHNSFRDIQDVKAAREEIDLLKCMDHEDAFLLEGFLDELDLKADVAVL